MNFRPDLRRKMILGSSSGVQGRREGILSTALKGFRMGLRGGGRKASGEAFLGKGRRRVKGRDCAECRDYGLANITIETADSIETTGGIIYNSMNYNYNVHAISNKSLSICRIRVDSIINSTHQHLLNPQGGGTPNKSSKVNRITPRQLRGMTKNSLKAIRANQVNVQPSEVSKQASRRASTYPRMH